MFFQLAGLMMWVIIMKYYKGMSKAPEGSNFSLDESTINDVPWVYAAKNVFLSASFMEKVQVWLSKKFPMLLGV